MQNNVRPDGSTYQGVEYNTDGTVYSKFTADGYSTDSTWSRRQAWGLYGFNMTYRNTQDSRFLVTAQQLADYFITHLRPDKALIAYGEAREQAFNANGQLRGQGIIRTTSNHSARSNHQLALLLVNNAQVYQNLFGSRQA